MYSQNLDNIKTELLIDDSIIEKAKNVLQRLKRSDTLTTGVFSRKTGLAFNLSEDFLLKCVELDILQVLILVPCLEEPEEHPPLTFNSVKEFTKAYSLPSRSTCPYCEESFNFNNPLVAFKRSAQAPRLEI